MLLWAPVPGTPPVNLGKLIFLAVESDEKAQAQGSKKLGGGRLLKTYSGPVEAWLIKWGLLLLLNPGQIQWGRQGVGGTEVHLEGVARRERLFLCAILGQNRYLACCWHRVGLWHHPPRLK